MNPEYIVDIARTWIKTPYHHQASLKGVGCDCLGFIRGVWREITGEAHEEIHAYSADWGELGSREILREAAGRYLNEIDISHPIKARRVTRTQIGDVVVFRMRAVGISKHCGFVAFKGGRRTLIHAAQSYPVSEVPFDFGWEMRLSYAFRFPRVESISVETGG